MESLIAALPPVLSAAITGIVTYLTMKSNNKLSMTDKEYDYIVKERNRMSEALLLEVTTLRNEKAALQEKVNILDLQEEECQRNILKYQFKIRELEHEIKELKLKLQQIS